MKQIVAASVSFFTHFPIMLERMEFAMLWVNLGCHLGKEVVLRPQDE